MPKRLLGVLMMVLMTLVIAAPAMAVEAEEEGEELEVEHEELPKYEEIGTGSEISQEFRPEPYEQPSLFAGILYPLAVIAGIAVLVIFGLYLLWQPRFSQEREAKKQKR
ncbi:MAG TPA: hypothetical protein VM287_01660 [Egibacteraceae bacterium]|nr:hypothetical protein [Egibacteraceae bacterium]